MSFVIRPVAGTSLKDHPVCSGRGIAPYTEPNVTEHDVTEHDVTEHDVTEHDVTEHDVMDVYGSASLTAWTVINTKQGKSAARV